MTRRTKFDQKLIDAFWVYMGEIEESEAQALAEAGYSKEYAIAIDRGERHDVLARARAFLDGYRLRDGGFARSASREVLPDDVEYNRPPIRRNDGVVSEEDSRWVLIQDLGKALTEAGGDDEFRPPLHRPVMEFSMSRDVRHPLQMDYVTVMFDGRMTQKYVIDAIREAWPMLKKHAWVRTTRPLGARKESLLRFVCIDRRDDLNTWTERLTAWNTEYPDWAYGSERAMHSAFRSGWQSLMGTGEESRFWFTWFTDAKVRQRDVDLGGCGLIIKGEGGDTA